MPVSYDTISLAEYLTFQTAYDYFNAELWGSKLPNVFITLQRKKGARGYFSPDRFAGRGSKDAAHELAMNPDCFVGRDDKGILSTLVHEMAHVWQNEFGKTPRGGYHNKQWAEEMKRIGLYPSDSGRKGGKETGQNMTHYILEDGAYATAYASLAATGLKLKWESKSNAKIRKAKAESKTKYTCPNCESNAWAKPDVSLICGECYADSGETHELVAQ